jgi:hypothetical protein
MLCFIVTLCTNKSFFFFPPWWYCRRTRSPLDHGRRVGRGRAVDCSLGRDSPMFQNRGNKPLSGRRHLSQLKKKEWQLGIKEKCYYFCLWAYNIKTNCFYVVKRAPEHYYKLLGFHCAVLFGPIFRFLQSYERALLFFTQIIIAILNRLRIDSKT